MFLINNNVAMFAFYRFSRYFGLGNRYCEIILGIFARGAFVRGCICAVPHLCRAAFVQCCIRGSVRFMQHAMVRGTCYAKSMFP